MRKSVLLAASAVLVTLALPQLASAAPTISAEALKAAIESTTGVQEVGYYHRRHHYHHRHHHYRGYGY